MTDALFWTNLAVMAAVTYLIRMLPLAIFRRKLKNRWIRSFLYYVPFAVLGAMTFPEIFFSTGSVWSATAGLITAAVLAYLEKGLLPVALSACGAALAVECVLRYALQ